MLIPQELQLSREYENKRNSWNTYAIPLYILFYKLR